MKRTVPALCAIALLSSAPARALDTDVTKFVGWQHAISEMKSKPVRMHSRPIANFLKRLDRINREINSIQYNSAFDAYWETPSEFHELGGQCRDFAVAKYARLYDLGVADADLELTVVRIRKTGEYHAVLVVMHQGRAYVLDNLRQDVQGPERMKDFEVMYFINRAGWGQSS